MSTTTWDQDNLLAAASPATCPDEEVTRSFRFTTLDGRGSGGWFGRRGELGEGRLVLDGRVIPLTTIQHVVARLNRLILTVEDGRHPVTTWAVTVRAEQFKSGRTVALELKQSIDRAISARRATMRLEALRRVGRDGAFRSAGCGRCGATIDLTGFCPTAQVHCPYCDTVAPPAAARAEAALHQCDACGYYARPEVFVSAVFVVRLVGAFWRSRRQYLCRACMRREGWATLWQNLPALLGLPLAAARLARAYLGGPSGLSVCAALDAANRHARDGQLGRAERRYQAILERGPYTAEVHFDRAQARAAAGDWPGCLDAVHAAWADCANFAPALPVARAALTALGHPSEARSLQTGWGQV